MEAYGWAAREATPAAEAVLQPAVLVAAGTSVVPFQVAELGEALPRVAQAGLPTNNPELNSSDLKLRS